MEVRTVWSVWFSATGTTRKVVTAVSRAVAQGLGAAWREYSFNLPAAREGELSFADSDLVVLGLPVYAGRVPNLLLPYVRDQVKGNGALAVPVVLYGNRNFDDALLELRNVMGANGFHPVTAGAFVGEHAFSRVLGAGRPDQEDMAVAATLAEETVKKVRSLEGPPAAAVEVEGCEPVRPYYTPRDRHGEPIRDFLKARPVTDPDRCVQCGLCARLCPLGSISPEDVTRVGRCFKCCACVKGCPMGAKSFTHQGYLYHQQELEAQYAGRRAPSRIFF